MSRVILDDSNLYVVYAEKSKRVMTGHASDVAPKLYFKGSANSIANETNKTQSKELFEIDGLWKARPVILKVVPDFAPKFVA